MAEGLDAADVHEDANAEAADRREDKQDAREEALLGHLACRQIEHLAGRSQGSKFGGQGSGGMVYG